MGQKVNPHGLRVGVIKDWDSRWFTTDKKEFGNLLLEDHNVRNFLKKRLYSAGVAKIEIERSANKLKLDLHVAKPGVVIGKAGAGIDALKAELEKMIGKEVDGKKVLIMGAGNIGTAVADRLLGFGMEIDGYDPYCAEKEQYKRILRTKEDLKNNLGSYDYIVSTLPDNDDTKKFINKELFVCMKNTAVIVNVGRKAVFDNDDFYAALKSGEIGGAVLDMFEKVFY